MTSNMSGAGITKCQFVRQEEVARGKWLSLNKIHYKDPTGKQREWEAVYRTTKNTNTADAVVVLPVLKRVLKFDCVILVKQYRPPIQNYTIEFPAGLIDKGEAAEICAVRELQEETGYIGTCKHVSPITCLDAGLGNASVTIVTVEVDGDLKENEDPKLKLDESEFIEVLIVPLQQLLIKLNELSESGVVIDSRVYTYAIAQEQTKHKQAVQSDQVHIEPESDYSK